MLRCCLTLPIVCLSLLLSGCEGNGPRSGSFAVGTSPEQAKPAVYGPSVKGSAPAVGQDNAGNNNGQAVIDSNKLETIRQQLNFHSPIVLKSELKTVVVGDAVPHVNPIFNALQNVELKRVGKAVSQYRAANGRAPESAEKLLEALQTEGAGLPELDNGQFYVYDPQLAEKESSKENLEYLEVCGQQ